MGARDLALKALFTVGATGCTDRTIALALCDDGRLDPGDVCLPSAGALRRADFEPLAMQVADFDGDDHLDVLMLGVVDWTIASVLLPGDGTGELGTARDPNVHGCSAYPIPGDIDGDAAADLLVAECGPSMLVLSGGAGGFGPGRSVPIGGIPRTSSILDADGDGLNDIVVLGSDATGLATMNVALADGHGGFAPPATSAVSSVIPGFDPYGFGTGDIDEDGALDVLLVDTTAPGRAALARGLGNGRFGAAQELPTGISLAGAWLRDFDADGHLDLLVRDDTNEEIVLLQGDGTGEFRAAVRTARAQTGPLASATIADLDGDGQDDLLFGYTNHALVEVWLGKGDGSFEAPTEFDASGEPLQIAAGDLDEDGALDIVVGTFAEGGIRVILARP